MSRVNGEPERIQQSGVPFYFGRSWNHVRFGSRLRGRLHHRHIAGKRFEQLKCGLRERLLWGSWKLQSSGLCGVSSSQKGEPHDCS